MADEELEKTTGDEEFVAPETGESKEEYEKMRCERIQKFTAEYLSHYQELCKTKEDPEANRQFQDYAADLGVGLNVALDMINKGYVDMENKFIDGRPSFAILQFSNETTALAHLLDRTNSEIDLMLGEARAKETKE